MEIKKYQAKVDEWVKTFGVRYFDPLTNTALLMEEVGELARLMARKHGEQSFKEKITEEQIGQKISDEIADIMFVLSCLANQHSIDLEKAIKKNFEKKSKRDLSRHFNNPKLNS